MKSLARAADADALRVRIASLTPTDPRHWGAMTVLQMVCHLADSFNIPTGERPISKPLKVSIPRPLYKWIALNTPTKWPQGVPTPPEMDQQIGGTAPAAFDADRALLLARLDTFLSFTGPWCPHPIFGPMTTQEWMRWGYLHTDHHLRQFGR